MHIPITQNAYSHNQIRISPPHFVCVYVYAGAINRPLQLLTVCQLRCEHSAKHSTYTHEMGCEHSARRRGPIHRARILTLPIAHIRITKYAYSHYQIRIFVSHYVCVYVYAGTINRPLQLLTVCQLRGEHSARLQRTHREKSTNTYEKPTKHSAKHSTYTYEMGYEHSARRRGRFIVPVS